MPREVHLVGSVPGASAAEVFERVSAALGRRLQRIPDGETGERGDWITWLETVFADSPALEQSDELFRLHATATRASAIGSARPLRRGCDLRQPVLCRYRRASYEEFARLKRAGKIRRTAASRSTSCRRIR